MSIFLVGRLGWNFLQGETICDFQIPIHLVALYVHESRIVKISTKIFRPLSNDRKQPDKIILHRIISAVWLTDFLSEIRSLINPRWWGKHLFLSVKRCSCPISYWYWTHWWSLASCLVPGADGGAAVWVVMNFILLVVWPL